MPRLLLLRHAKSDWSDDTRRDFDRPLNPRGGNDAPRIAGFIAERGLLPQRILCSTAMRTRQTLAALVPHLAYDTDIRLTHRLYEADASGYLAAVKEGGDAETLMLVGHNPAIEDVASLLAGRGDTATLKRLHDKFPTAALAVIDVDAPRFADAVPGGGHLAAFVTPADLGPA